MAKRSEHVHQAVHNKRQGRKVQALLVRRLGGKNVGTIEGQDGSHEIWSIEVKNRASFVGETFMLQCERNCPSGKTPLTVIHVTGRRHDSDMVMMRLRDFEEWFGKLNPTEGEKPRDNRPRDPELPKPQVLIRRSF